MTKVMRALVGTGLLLMSSIPALGAVRFAEWSPDTIDAVIEGAAARDANVMVVITQPDWCPGCIQLDRALLRNPEAHEVAELTEDWVVLEILGYDEPDASVLAAQGLGFLGTPTTLLLKPGPDDERLGDARQLAAIVGFPEDYLEQLSRAAAGHDAIAAAQVLVRERNDAASLQELARAYLAAGQADAARRIFQSVLLREELSYEERRAVALQSVLQPTQRVEKDHRRALAELDAWAAAYPEGREEAEYVYARAWSLLSLGERDAALAFVREAYAGIDDPDATARYLYLAFRDPTELLLADAEQRARAAVKDFPDQAARFHAAHGRILRRQGDLAAAEAAFLRAVELTEPGDAARVTYTGQLEFVRQQRAQAGG
ncbi:hypothetical protein [Wenzhouxiangella sp. XN24]|uniref:hypothetical protein n=1 Tax=Wenzhouxiangella sp. XN24 TaxID=2713569 RepID=UPI0013EB387F|nr:hypothetical protein [Wenzhouxiangella sp. XN24]NGX16597.1 hypothetical protein [Wenzhouxiangella sp. XN24]